MIQMNLKFPIFISLVVCLLLIGQVQAATSQYPPVQSDTYVHVTTYYSADYYHYFATDPTKSVTGTSGGNAWVAGAPSVNHDQRFSIDLGSAKVINRIYYENYHNNATSTNFGIKNFTIWGSDSSDSFADTTYADDTGWTQLTAAQLSFDRHAENANADPKYIAVSNTETYRYYSFKFSDAWGGGLMGVRRIVLQTDYPLAASFNITLTDTTTGAPTSWQWNATNLLGNNTPFTFSTDQNPTITLSQGNWLIDLIATNFLGSDTCNSTIGINLTSPQVYFWSRTS